MTDRWIPVSERLPEPRSRVLVAVRRLASAYVGAITGDEPRTVRELSRLSRAVGRER